MSKQLTIPADVPSLYAQDRKAGHTVVHAKYFTPDAQWTWYMTEYNPITREAFGLVIGLETEAGYFSMDELESVRGPLGLPVERDEWFEPCEMKDLRDAGGNLIAPAWWRKVS